MATIKTSRAFSDIDLTFRANPFTGDIYTKTDEEAVKTALKHLIQTRNFERKFRPDIGTQVYSLLFENKSAAVDLALERSITEAIEKYEPRVRLIDVRVEDLLDTNDLRVTIEFTLKNIDAPITVTTILSRVR